jgi:osmotically-inducible protein OsmY
MFKGSAALVECCIDSCQYEHDPASLVAARLRRSDRAYLWGIRCEFDQGVLSLRGAVPTFHLKQLAQELALHTPGVHGVNNCLHVTSSLAPRTLERPSGFAANDRQPSEGSGAVA